MPIGVMVTVVTPLGLDLLADYHREIGSDDAFRLTKAAASMRRRLSKKGIYLDEPTKRRKLRVPKGQR